MVAPNTEFFSWQVNLAFHQHLKLGLHRDDFIVLSPNKNRPSDTVHNYFGNNTSVIATKPFWEHLGVKYDGLLLPINIQTSLLQYNIDPSETYIIFDPDMFIISIPKVSDNVVHENVYESWHLFLQGSNSFIKGALEFNYSGFVPIIIRGSILKLILNDWVQYHLELYDTLGDIEKIWWAGMYAYNLACCKNGINITEKRLCAIPGLDSVFSQDMFCIHYSSATRYFDKKLGFKFSETGQLSNVDYCFLEILKEFKNRLND